MPSKHDHNILKSVFGRKQLQILHRDLVGKKTITKIMRSNDQKIFRA